MFRALLAVAVLLLSACSGSAAEPTRVEFVVSEAPPGQPQRIEIPLGSEVTLIADSEINDRLHVHGYELEPELEAGESTTLTFTADMSGVYEVETHSNGAIWLKLAIQ